MIEYFPEPIEREPVGECVECEKPLYEGDIVVYINDEYICLDCSKNTALEDSAISEFKEYIIESDLVDDYAKWFYELRFVTLGDD